MLISIDIGCNAGGSLTCLNGGTCQSSGSCLCLSGFSGLTCATQSGCTLGICLNGGICQNSGSSFICICQSGYSGSRCETGMK